MGVAEVIAMVNVLLGAAFRIYESIDQTAGNVPIPTWDEIASKNAITQAKIDAEK